MVRNNVDYECVFCKQPASLTSIGCPHCWTVASSIVDWSRIVRSSRYRVELLTKNLGVMMSCPHCGKVNLRLMRTAFGFCVFCNECDLGGPKDLSRRKAFDKWNGRYEFNSTESYANLITIK